MVAKTVPNDILLGRELSLGKYNAGLTESDALAEQIHARDDVPDGDRVWSLPRRGSAAAHYRVAWAKGHAGR